MAASRAKTLHFLVAEQVKRLHACHIDPKAQPTQPNLLFSALDSPINQKHYAQEENVFKLAAILSEKLMKNHAYGDGNKRTALLAAATFLKINGYALQQQTLQAADKNSQGLEEAHVAVCSNSMTTEQLAEYYESVAVETPYIA